MWFICQQVIHIVMSTKFKNLSAFTYMAYYIYAYTLKTESKKAAFYYELQNFNFKMSAFKYMVTCMYI